MNVPKKVAPYKFTLSFCILALLIGLRTPFQPIFSLVLLSYFPGIFLASLVKKEFNLVEGLFLPLLLGISFWIVFFHFFSELKILHWLTGVVISFLSAVLTDKQIVHICINRTDFYEMIFLLVCCAFMVSYSYPWSQFYEWIPPGDDMKYHAYFIEETVATRSLPSDYGELYPELTTMTYPVGYHIIVSLALLSDTSVSSIVIVTFFLVPLSCFSFYFLGKTLFNRRVGLYSAFSLSFLSLFFHRLLATSTYPNLLAITLQVLALFYLFEAFYAPKSKGLLGLSALAFAASGVTHPYIFVSSGIFLLFLFGWAFLVKDFLKVKVLMYVGMGFLFLSIPYFLRLEFYPLSDIEWRTFSVWYAADSITSFSSLVKNVSFLSPLVVLFGICGLLTLKKRNVAIMTLWMAAMLVIPVLSAFQLKYPGWYAISPNRFLLFLFMPLCVMCGKFLVDVEKLFSRKKFLSLMGVLILFSAGMHHFNMFSSFSPDPVNEVQMNSDDRFVMEWITHHADEDAVILNTGATIDCSSWVPVLSKRRVIFPFFSGYRGDRCITKLKHHEKLADFQILIHIPDSETALAMLREYDVDYIYIPAWRKKYHLDMCAEPFLQSPLYQLMVKKGDAYVFRVDYDENPEKILFAIFGTEHILLKGNKMETISFVSHLSADVYGSYYLFIEYEDDADGHLNVGQNNSYLGTVFTYNTDKEKSIIFPLSKQHEIELLFHPEVDLLLKEVRILFGMENAVKISEHIGLKGNWIVLESGEVTAPAEDEALRIYLFNIEKGELVILYEDTGYGNVDISISDALGRWHGVTVIYRENSGEIREVRVPIEKEYSIFVLGVYVHGEDFTVCGFSYE
ncbi:MAG: hypothetical protein AYK18_15555 [Theionarchaea archaeon DG-70]|nr:MAG: hypothetical protein AYK18_15555 [Theionarchaea archaeon DG-70]